MCIYIYIYIHILYTYIDIYTHIHIYTCIYIYIYIHIHIHVYIYICTWEAWLPDGTPLLKCCLMTEVSGAAKEEQSEPGLPITYYTILRYTTSKSYVGIVMIGASVSMNTSVSINNSVSINDSVSISTTVSIRPAGRELLPRVGRARPPPVQGILCYVYIYIYTYI